MQGYLITDNGLPVRRMIDHDAFGAAFSGQRLTLIFFDFIQIKELIGRKKTISFDRLPAVLHCHMI
jgi:hypothetical protein